ncbi:MAG TPA: hypothetical protein VJW96_03135 [Terriglobales bacterium]|jgi:hypothetical protein|nr:hypothetical protein [Terriglobales bacterium]
MQCVAVEVDADDLEPAVKHAGRVLLLPDCPGQPQQQALKYRPL